MKDLVKWLLVPALVTAGLVLFSPGATQAGRWRFHGYSHYHGPRAHHYHYSHGYPHYYPRYYCDPCWAPVPYWGPTVVRVRPAPVIVAAPAYDAYYGPVRGPRPVLHYGVW